ncbi:putative phage tail fiber protein [Escherichia coli]|nr:putative phage tail fiber protein [Escherichia coli]
MLAVAKAAKRQEIETWRTEQETQSFTFEKKKKTWNAGPDSMARLYPVVMAAKFDTARTTQREMKEELNNLEDLRSVRNFVVE